MLPDDPFGRDVALPATFDRAHRVRLLAEAFAAWEGGEQPSAAARLFVAGGALAWLAQGGDLIGDYWKCRGRQGSTATPARILRALRKEGQANEAAPPFSPSDPTESTE